MEDLTGLYRSTFHPLETTLISFIKAQKRVGKKTVYESKYIWKTITEIDGRPSVKPEHTISSDIILRQLVLKAIEKVTG